MSMRRCSCSCAERGPFGKRPELRGLLPPHPDHLDRLGQHLAFHEALALVRIGRRREDRADHVHPLDHAAERGVACTQLGVLGARIGVEAGLVRDQDREIAGRGAGLEERHFAHWLTLFYATLRELEPTDAATRLVGERARMIADSLLTGIETRRNGLAGARAGESLPHA